MSTNVYWEPVQKERNWLDCSLKFALQKKYGGCFDVKLGYSSIEYLSGLRDAGVKGAQELIDAIEEYDEIHVAEE